MSLIEELLWGSGPIAAIQHFFGPDWLALFATLTLLGDLQAVVFIAAIIFWIRGPRLATALLAVVLLGGVTNMLLSNLLGVPRPDNTGINIHQKIGIPSFPSGHTVSATTAWASLALWGQVPAWVAAFIIWGVMLSRLYLGVHYIADVLAGFVLGLTVVAIFRRVWPPLDRRIARLSFRFYLLLGMAAVTLAVGAFPAFSTFLHGWQTLGAMAGFGIAVPLAYRYAPFHPIEATLWKQWAKLAVGIAALLAPLLPGALIGDRRPVAGAILYALAAIWAILLAPLVFGRLGLSGRPISGRETGPPNEIEGAAGTGCVTRITRK